MERLAALLKAEETAVTAAAAALLGADDSASTAPASAALVPRDAPQPQLGFLRQLGLVSQPVTTLGPPPGHPVRQGPQLRRILTGTELEDFWGQSVLQHGPPTRDMIQQVENFVQNQRALCPDRPRHRVRQPAPRRDGQQ